jgi:hypothetical protein
MSSSTSLKSFIPNVARGLNVTPASLYERQRVLVRAGLLHSKGGRGPGSGVRANPESVAMLLISLLASGSLSETEEHTTVVAKLKSRTTRCILTGKRTFATALTAVLASEEIAKNVGWIDVDRGSRGAEAHIGYKGNSEVKLPPGQYETAGGIRVSEFGLKDAARESRLQIRATLLLPFGAMARVLKEASK